MLDFLKKVSPFSRELVNPAICEIDGGLREEIEDSFKKSMEDWFKTYNVVQKEFAFKSVSGKTTMFWIIEKNGELISLKLTIFYKDEPYNRCAFFMYRKSGKRYDGLETQGEIKIKTMLYQE